MPTEHPRLRPPSWPGLLLAALTLAGCQGAGPKEAAAVVHLEPAKFGGLKSCFQWGEMYLGSVPGPEELELAARRGVGLLLDLRQAPGPDRDLALQARDLGMDYIHAPIDPEQLADAEVDQALAALEDAGDRPPLLFCETGSRAAMVAALFRIERQPDSLEASIEDARRAGMKPGTSESALRRQAARLIAGDIGTQPAGWSGPPPAR
jgi:uncharacterized protein (TIGR01244 family)